jgi:hypothetical protein
VEQILNIECRGIAKYGSSFVVLSNTDGIFIIDEKLNVKMKKVLSEKVDLHGVAVENEKAYIVETKTNSIGIYDLKNNIEKVDEIKISPENDDVCHVNDLFIENDKLYISMFSYPQKKNLLSFDVSEKHIIGRGVIIEYSLKKRKIINICHDKLFQPHSVQLYDDQLYYCVSGKSLVKRNKEVIFRCPGYPRGLAVKGSTMFIGQSMNRTKEQTDQLPDCGIYLHDLSTNTSSFIPIPANEIYGIVMI